jgi:hypothetical protein
MRCVNGMRRALSTLIVLAGCGGGGTAARNADGTAPEATVRIEEFELRGVRGAVLPDGRKGGAVLVGRAVAGQERWSNFLWEFSGLLFDKEAKVALVRGELLVYTAAGRSHYACDAASGAGLAKVRPDDPRVVQADELKLWARRAIAVDMTGGRPQRARPR